MKVTIEPQLLISRLEAIFGKRKKLESRLLRITTNSLQQAAVFQCGSQSLGFQAEVHEEGEAVMDADSVRKIFSVLAANRPLEIAASGVKATIRQGNYLVKIECRGESGTSSAASLFHQERFDVLKQERRRLLREVAKIDAELASCRKVIRDR